MTMNRWTVSVCIYSYHYRMVHMATAKSIQVPTLQSYGPTNAPHELSSSLNLTIRHQNDGLKLISSMALKGLQLEVSWR
jgi:hypothetical protein